MQNEKNPSWPDRSDGGGDAVRKAFVFYVNWFEDTADALSREEQGDFFRAIVRYASRGELPGDDVSSVVRGMFKLIRPAIDSNFEKFDKKTEANKKRAAKSAEKRASQCKKTKKEKIVDNQQFSASEHIIENCELRIENRELLFDDEKERMKESLERDLAHDHDAGAADDGGVQAGGSCGQTGAPCGQAETLQTDAAGESDATAVPTRDEVKAYWRERSLKSDWTEFYSYYERMAWRNVKGQRLRSWKSAAFFWEEKYRRDVLPAIRRTAAAEAQVATVLKAKSRAAENARVRAEAREAFSAEADERAAKAVTPEMGKYMYNRALELCNGDSDGAIELLKRGDSDPTLFARLADGYRAA